MTALEERIIAFVVAETAINPKRLQFGSRLAQDVGMDGDDAVEFFERFGEEFHVDLTVLYHHWQEHFLPEGGGPSLWFMVVIGAAVVLGDLLHRAFQPIPSWAWMIALIAVSLWVSNKLFTERVEPSPITVQDLVDAAISGKWDRQYESTEILFRTLQ